MRGCVVVVLWLCRGFSCVVCVDLIAVLVCLFVRMEDNINPLTLPCCACCACCAVCVDLIAVLMFLFVRMEDNINPLTLPCCACCVAVVVLWWLCCGVCALYVVLC